MANGGGDGSNHYKRATGAAQTLVTKAITLAEADVGGAAQTPLEKPITLAEAGIDKNLAGPLEPPARTQADPGITQTESNREPRLSNSAHGLNCRRHG